MAGKEGGLNALPLSLCAPPSGRLRKIYSTNSIGGAKKGGAPWVTGAICCGAIVGLVTGVLALGTAVFTMRNEMQASQNRLAEQNDRLAENQKLLLQAQQAYEQQRKADIEAQAEAARLKEHETICANHQATRMQIEDRFAKLMDDHSVLLNMLKKCFENPNKDSRSNCALVTCGTAYFVAGSNCLSIGATAGSIEEDMKREDAATYQDGCVVPNTAATTFFAN